MLVCREQSPKEIKLYLCQAGSFPGPHKQLREGGGCSGMDREELHPDVDLAGSRQICATLGAGSGQRYGPGISCRWEQLLSCYPQLWKLCSAFIPSHTFPTTLFKALGSSIPWISVFCKLYFIVFQLWPCSHHKAECLCTGLGAALCPDLSKAQLE